MIGGSDRIGKANQPPDPKDSAKQGTAYGRKVEERNTENLLRNQQPTSSPSDTSILQRSVAHQYEGTDQHSTAYFECQHDIASAFVNGTPLPDEYEVYWEGADGIIVIDPHDTDTPPPPELDNYYISERNKLLGRHEVITQCTAQLIEARNYESTHSAPIEERLPDALEIPLLQLLNLIDDQQHNSSADHQRIADGTTGQEHHTTGSSSNGSEHTVGSEPGDPARKPVVQENPQENPFEHEEKTEQKSVDANDPPQLLQPQQNETPEKPDAPAKPSQTAAPTSPSISPLNEVPNIPPPSYEEGIPDTTQPATSHEAENPHPVQPAKEPKQEKKRESVRFMIGRRSKKEIAASRNLLSPLVDIYDPTENDDHKQTNPFQSYLNNNALSNTERDKKIQTMIEQGLGANRYKLTGKAGFIHNSYVVEVQLGNGHKCLMFRSSGAKGSDDKPEWVPFPGFAPISRPAKTTQFIVSSDNEHAKTHKYGVPVFQTIANDLKEYEPQLLPDLKHEEKFSDLNLDDGLGEEIEEDHPNENDTKPHGSISTVFNDIADTPPLHLFDPKKDDEQTTDSSPIRPYDFAWLEQDSIDQKLSEMKEKGSQASKYQIANTATLYMKRHIIEVKLDNDYTFLMYRSTGTGTGMESEGEWVPIPGFCYNPYPTAWFIKSGRESKLDKYNIPIYQKIAKELKEHENRLIPNLPDDEGFVDDDADV